VYCQSDEVTGRHNRGEIMTIMSILIGHFTTTSCCRSWQSFSINQSYEKIHLINTILIE